MIAIIADIHGNYPALKAVMSDIEKYDVERIYSLGDVAGYYSMINECIHMLIECNVTNILGNHDDYLIRGGHCPRSESANKCIAFQKKVIEKEPLSWLRKSPEKIDFAGVSMVHGGWNDYLDEYMYCVKEEYFADKIGKFFFSGHTHVQTLKSFDSKTYCNPGSVGQPRDGDPRAGYALFDGKAIILKRIEYNIQEIADNMAEQGFGEYFFRDLFTGSRIGGTIDTMTD